MPSVFCRPALFVVLFVLLAASTSFPAAQEWLPIDSADLAMKDNPASPGSQAMILYRSVERNDALGYESEYVRLKIFTEEGKRHANVVIPWGKGHYSAIDNVRGRTIHPDGSIVPFTGEVLETVHERRGFGFAQLHEDTRRIRTQVKTLALPDVTPGSVVEYQYTLHWQVMGDRTYWFRGYSDWEVQQELFQRKAHFLFKPFRTQLSSDLVKYAARTVALPPTAKMVQGNDDSIALDVENVAAFQREDLMPPESELMARVMFFYSEADMYNPDKFWKAEAKEWQKEAEEYMNRRSAVEQQLASIVTAADDPDAKLHKIYDYVQSLENYSYGTSRTHKGLSEENNNVEDVIRHKYGYRHELSRLFVALARAAGIDATLVRSAARSDSLFHKDWPSMNQLSLEFVLVRKGGQEIFLNPGTYSCPFGTILWEQSGSMALKLDKNPPVFVQIPLPDASTNQYKSVGTMTLDERGTLSGQLEVTLTGQAAIDQRIPALLQDDEERQKHSIQMLKNWLGVPAEVSLENVNSWTNSTPLVLKYKVSIPHFGSVVGRRVLLRATLLPGAYRNPFASSRRVHPVVMEYPYRRIEDVTIVLPRGFEADTLPAPKEDKNAVGELTTKYVHENGTLRVVRDFRLVGAGMKIDVEFYPALRSYFQNLQAGTNETVVLKNNTTGTPGN